MARLRGSVYNGSGRFTTIHRQPLLSQTIGVLSQRRLYRQSHYCGTALYSGTHVSGILLGGIELLQREAPHRVFADAAKVEGVVVFDDVGNLEIAVGGAILEVFDDATFAVQPENK